MLDFHLDGNLPVERGILKMVRRILDKSAGGKPSSPCPLLVFNVTSLRNSSPIPAVTLDI